MNIGFDAKRIFHNQTGLGNFSRDITRIMSQYYPGNQYFLYNPRHSDNGFFRATGANVHEVLPRNAFDRFFSNIWRQYGIGKEFKRDGIDLFHGLSGEIPIRRARNKIPVLVTVHDLIFLRFPQFYSLFDRVVHRIKARHACRNADFIVAVSDQTRHDVIDFFDVSPEKVKVIYQGCQDVFKKRLSKEQVDEVRRKYGLPENYIFNVGTIEERKNILVGVKAMRDMDSHLVVVGGETPYFQRINRYISQNGMEKKVSFLRNVSNEELAALYQGAAVFIYPSLFEGFGIPIIEAIHSNTPVITSKGGCFSEAGGPGSIYVNPNDPEELAFQIRRVLNDETLRKSMVQSGLQHVEKFSDQNIAENYMKLYNWLLGME
ncbi:MAG: glycosyltransferase family 4 protein [Bacteroidota bacterium]